MIKPKRVYDLTETFTEFLLKKAAARAFPGRGGALPPVLLIAMPKSGSIFMQRALRRTLRVPVHHITGGSLWGSTFRDPDLRQFEQGNVVAREHLQPRPFMLKALAQHGVKKAVLHVRDPRPAIISWAKHMDRMLEVRGLRGIELSCEADMPGDYVTWSFGQRLAWQVDNLMPRFVQWIEDWLVLVDGSRHVEFLVTDYGDLRKDGRALITRILDFYAIPYTPDWISIPSTEFGRNNIYTVLAKEPDAVERQQPSWVKQMPPDVLSAANGMVPTSLCDRFGWPKL